MNSLIGQPDSHDYALREAANDLRFLFDREYPRDACLELVGNRYDLNREERSLLKRAVSGAAESWRRKAKAVSFRELAGKEVAVDGYNTLITIESGLLDRPLVLADDGAVRDIAGIFAAYRVSKTTEKAVWLMAETLIKAKVGRVTVLLLSSMSKSGELAAEMREIFQKEGLDASCRVENAVEKELPLVADIVATGNSAIMERAMAVFDLAGYIIREILKKTVPSL